MKSVALDRLDRLTDQEKKRSKLRDRRSANFSKGKWNGGSLFQDATQKKNMQEDKQGDKQ